MGKDNPKKNILLQWFVVLFLSVTSFNAKTLILALFKDEKKKAQKKKPAAQMMFLSVYLLKTSTVNVYPTKIFCQVLPLPLVPNRKFSVHGTVTIGQYFWSDLH